jgi:tetratricopeptide (TPR) repeat protein
MPAAPPKPDPDNSGTTRFTPAKVISLAAVALGLIHIVSSQKAPEADIARFNRADVLRQQGALDEAISAFSRMIEDRPFYALAFNGRGESYLAKGDLARARADFDKSISLFADDWVVYLNRCQLNYRSGDLDKALDDCAHTSRLKPSEDRAHLVAAKIRIDQKLYAEAENALGHAIAANNANAESYLLRGQIRLFFLDRAADAAEDFSKGLKAAFTHRDLARLLPGPKSEAAQPSMANGRPFYPDAPLMIVQEQIARHRAGLDGRAALEEAYKGLSAPVFRELVFQNFENVQAEVREKTLQPWPGPILRLFMGEIDEAALATTAERDYTVVARARCDAAFYGAQHLLLDNKTSAASDLLQSALAQCSLSQSEAGLAAAELARVK